MLLTVLTGCSSNSRMFFTVTLLLAVLPRPYMVVYACNLGSHGAPRKIGLPKSHSVFRYLSIDRELAVPSFSAWSSPCILVPKTSSTFRFCTDYQIVNTVTKPHSFPPPHVEDCVDQVGAAGFVSKLDLLKGCWKVTLKFRATEISAFVTLDSFIQYSVMAFGLRNAPATFQRLMNWWVCRTVRRTLMMWWYIWLLGLNMCSHSMQCLNDCLMLHSHWIWQSVSLVKLR